MSKKSDLEIVINFTKEFFSSLTEGYLKQLTGYHSDLLEKCEQLLTDIQTEKNNEDKFEQLILYFAGVLDYLKTNDLLLQDKNEIQWIEHFDESISQIQKTVTLSIPKKLYDRNENDTFNLRFLKSLYRKYISLADLLRSMMKRENPEGRNRIFNQRDFYRFYLALPISGSILEEKQRARSIYSNLIYSFKKETEKLKDQILLKSENDSTMESYEQLYHLPLKDIVIEYKNCLKSISEQMHFFKKDVQKRLLESLSRVEESLDLHWEQAGTPLNTSRNFSNSRYQKRLMSLNRSSIFTDNQWQNHLNGLKEEWQKDLELMRLQLTTLISYHKYQQIILNKLSDKILPLFLAVKSAISDSLNEIKSSGKGDKVSGLQSILANQGYKLLRDLRQNKLPELHTAIVQSNFEPAFLGLLKHVEEKLEDLSDRHIVMVELDMENLPPDSKTDLVPLKELVHEEILPKAKKEIIAGNTQIQIDIEYLLRNVLALDQIIEYNLEEATSLLKDEQVTDVQPIDIATKGLNLALAKVDELIEKISSTIDNGLNILASAAFEIENKLDELGDSKQIIKIKIRLARAKAKEDFIELKSRIWQSIKYFIPRAFRLITSWIIKLKEGYFKVRKVAGLDIQGDISIDHFRQFISVTEQRVGQMPYIYQRLFRLDPLNDKRFFCGRENSLQQLAESFDQYKSGQIAAAAIVGEKGNGKTTIIELARKDIFQGSEVLSMNFNDTIFRETDLVKELAQMFSLNNINTIKDLEESILDSEIRKVVIIENVHNLFLRTIDGFKTLESLLLLISNTQSEIFWVVTCGFYGWNYLDKIIHISKYFKNPIIFEKFENEDLKNLILKRHIVSGYGLKFIASEQIKKLRQYKKLSTEDLRQEFLKDKFFEDLVNFAGNNITVTMLHWLSAIESFKEDEIQMKSEIELDFSFLLHLPAEELFTFAAFIQHEYLNISQHALIFNQKETESELLLNNLNRKGFIKKESENFSIHPFVFHPVIKILKTKNILI